MKKILSLLMLLSLGSNILSQPRFMQPGMMSEEDGSAIGELIDLKKTLGKIKLAWAGLKMKKKAAMARLMLKHKKESIELKIRDLMDLQEGKSIEEAAPVWKDRLLDLANEHFSDWEEFGKMFMKEKLHLAQMTRKELDRFGYQPRTRMGKAIKGKLEEMKSEMKSSESMPEEKMPMATSTMIATETEK